MAGDPNLQIDPNKAIPAPDNILHQFKNYTYKISLLSFKSVQAYNDLAENGNWQWCLGNIPAICNTLFSSGGIPEGANEFLPARHPSFELDFFIETLTTSGMMGMNSASRATNIMELAMVVTEPTGTTLLERMHDVLTEEDSQSWTEKPMLIQIDFLGYTEDERPVRITPATRWIPVRLANMEFDISPEGTSYNIDFIAMAVLEGNANPLTQSLNLKMIKGKTLVEILEDIANEFNREQEERLGSSGKKGGPRGGKRLSTIVPKTQEVADSIEFKIADGVSKPAGAALLAAEISPNVAKQTLLKVRPDDTPPGKGKAKFKYDSSIRYYGDGDRGEYKLEFTTPGQSLLSIIEKIIRDSTYITKQIKPNTTLDQMSDPKSVLQNPEKGLDWFKITYVKILKDFDKIRNKYGRHTIIQIDPYKVADPEITGGTSKPGDNGIKSVARSYDYIYSGQSLDIKNLQLTFNNAFLQAMTGADTKTQSSENPTVTSDKEGPSVSPEAGNKQDGASAISGKSDIQPKNNKFIADPHATDQQRTGATLMENLYRNPGSDMMTIDLEIIGDPGYIQQDGILTMRTPNKTGTNEGGTGHDTANGAILCDLDDCHFYLTFKTPRDYNEASGLADFGTSSKYGGSTLSGFFRVWEVNSTFQGGQFTQTLSATRIYNQWRENKTNPEKGEDLLSSAESASYDFEDAKVAAAAMIAPGAAAEAAVNSEFAGLGAAPKPWEIDAGEFAGVPLPAREIAKQNELARELADSEWANEFAGVNGPFTETLANKNSVNPHADFNTIALQNRPQSAAEFRAAEARSFQLNQLNTTSQTTGTVSAQLRNTPAGLTPNRANPGEASGPVTFRASTPIESYRSSPSFVTTTGGSVLTPPVGSSQGTVSINPHINTSSYDVADHNAISSNNEVERTERQNVIDLTTAGLAIAGAAAWARGNSASEDSKIRHGKYGNEYNSWKDNGYLIDILPINPLTGQ